MSHQTENVMTSYLLLKNLISALESLARSPILSAFSALNLNFLFTQIKWSNHIPIGLKAIQIIFYLIPICLFAQPMVTFVPQEGKSSYQIAGPDKQTTILYDGQDEVLIAKTAAFLADDIERVTGKRPMLATKASDVKGSVIILGSVEKSSLIKTMIKNGKLKTNDFSGKWESFVSQYVSKPLKGISEAVVIAGSDKRGTAFGAFTLSEKMGVSPWYYWADVPVARHEQIFVSKARYVSKPPSVKYRGIFLNDEAPALRNWAKEQFGDFNHLFYEKIFELLLRNKANYLWPAMWQPSVFATDDPLNMQTADEYGIVISTTHHEPMMRYHEEWGREKGGEWNYETNKEKLRAFWKAGIERMGDYESVVALGMRGDGDQAMTEGTVVDLLKTIIKDQRKIIGDVTGKPVDQTPQVWALYKEVQDYYDKGMRLDDDVLVLFCDDNWGNVRILPKKADMKHKGGYGMYYHFDFVGGPVSYRWINVSQVERVWEQMKLSYDWGVRDLWIVNVGDLKPMELPISLFLDLAWNTEAIQAKDLPAYYLNWTKQQFGDFRTQEIADLIATYTKYSARRTPEMLKPDTYHLENYREADRILDEYQSLLQKSNKIYAELPAAYRSAYYQLVHFPIAIAANLNEMYIYAGKNALYANQSRASANKYADLVKEKFFKDASLTKQYHTELEGGKWNHMMSQTHIGYTNWNNPPMNKMPEITYVQAESEASAGYVVEGAPINRFRRSGLLARTFSTFDSYNDQHFYLEIFNKGSSALDYEIEAKQAWIQTSLKKGSITSDTRIEVSINWEKLTAGEHSGEVVLRSGGQEWTIAVPVKKYDQKVKGFVENNGVVSMEAAHFSRKVDQTGAAWGEIPNLGRTGSGLTVFPSNADVRTPGADSPYLEYEFNTLKDADMKLQVYLSPTLNYKKGDGLKLAVSLDDGDIQLINVHEGDQKPDWEYPDWWNNSVTDHIRIKQADFKSIKAGSHTLKVFMVDPGLVLQKLVVDAGGLKPSYLGPPESKIFGVE